ncbi:MAG: lyase family protein [Candidatus Woesearchaeota archaeon]|nr:lyase family protein [Candidatus Woesearchaeota archaeon]
MKHTERSLENFDVAGEPLPIEIIRAITKLKIACARANASLGALTQEQADAIIAACDEILTGKHDEKFAIDVFQAGSGTSSHMNVNEMIAELANVHPNDHVNMGQSTNNVMPSAIKIAANELAAEAVKSLQELAVALRKNEGEFSSIRTSGRTHLQDAVPITLGQKFGAYATAIEQSAERLESSNPRALGIGGNAIGTGVNTKKEFRSTIVRELNKRLTTDYVVAKDGIHVTQFLTDIAALSAAVKLASMDMLKISNDLRLLASGPHTGFGELNLPEVEPGSSIMPGKVNPTICEAACMACMQIQGLDHAVTLACSAGQLELNTHMPLIGSNLVRELQILARCATMLSEKCIAGITANEETCKKHFETSAGLATLLNPRLGYDAVAELVKESLRTGKSFRELVVEKQLMPAEEFDELLTSPLE